MCGVAINKNYQNNIDELGRILKKTSLRVNEKQGETFGSVDKMQSISDRLDVLFTENGTFGWCNLFDTADMAGGWGDIAAQKDTKIIVFAISETSMSFTFNYFEDGINVRRFQETWNDTIGDYKRRMSGNPLPEEATDEDRAGVILDIVSRLIERNFYEIDDAEPVTRYIFC